MSPEAAYLSLTLAPLAVGTVAALVFSGPRSHIRRAVFVSLGAFASACVAAVVAVLVEPTPVGSTLAVGGVFSGAGSVCLLIIAAICAAAARVSDRPRPRPEVLALLGLGTTLLVASIDLLMMVLCAEMVALSSYALVASARTRRARETVLSYFVQGGVATSFLVLGVGVIFGLYGGRTSALDLNEIVLGADLAPAALGLTLIVGGLSLKAAVFPFHSWAPEVYDTAEEHSAAALASVPKVAYLMALGFIVAALLGGYESGLPTERLAHTMDWMLAVLAAGSIVFGNFAALRQTSVARVLAYSGIAQVGYALVGVIVGDRAGSAMLLSGYAVAASLAFLVAAGVRRRDSRWAGDVAGLAGLSVHSPLLAFVLAVSAFSMTGIPPLFGFWGKFFIFVSALSGEWWWLAALGAAGSVVSFGYYGGLIRAAYFSGEGDTQSRDVESAASEGPYPERSLALIVLVALLIVGGLIPLLGGVSVLERFFG